MLKIVLSILIVLISNTSLVSAQTKPLAYACEFFQGYSWQSSDKSYLGDKTADKLELVFTVDTPNSGKMIGNGGASEVAIIDADAGITFLEPTATGNIATTTVFKSGSSLKNKAVHSRHMSLLDSVIVSQYVGNCELKR